MPKKNICYDPKHEFPIEGKEERRARCTPACRTSGRWREVAIVVRIRDREPHPKDWAWPDMLNFLSGEISTPKIRNARKPRKFYGH